mmetsp:Transcript_16517/g.51681  ORF Transcript_16517/g.51681 Transcript_16517/m.51681 type:complete len:246 (+) Transcript_16517:587-1324(+)
MRPAEANTKRGRTLRRTTHRRCRHATVPSGGSRASRSSCQRRQKDLAVPLALPHPSLMPGRHRRREVLSLPSPRHAMREDHFVGRAPRKRHRQPRHPSRPATVRPRLAVRRPSVQDPCRPRPSVRPSGRHLCRPCRQARPRPCTCVRRLHLRRTCSHASRPTPRRPRPAVPTTKTSATSPSAPSRRTFMPATSRRCSRWRRRTWTGPRSLPSPSTSLPTRRCRSFTLWARWPREILPRLPRQCWS